MEINESILHVVEVFLYENYLTPKEGDYTARIETERTLSLKPVCESAALRGGSDISAASMLHASELMLKEAAYLLCDGFSINFGYFTISMKIKGVFNSPRDTFDPARHTLLFQITPNAPLRKESSNIQIKMMGVKKGITFIDLVTDTTNGLFDGTITPNEDILIQGGRICIAPDLGGEDTEVGIFFIAEDGTTTPVTRRLTQNKPSSIIARVPNLPAGEYRLKIVTKYVNRKELLKNPHIAEYDKLLVVL